MGTRRPTQNVGQSIALATVAMQAGCMIVVLIFMGLGAGVLLDNLLGTRPILTLALLLLSIPISLGVSVFSLLRTSRGIQELSEQDDTPTPTKETNS
jgi:F0F1-type ATP synthase assembly protein I